MKQISMDPRVQREQLQKLQSAFDDQTSADVLVEGDRRLILRSPNGHFWSVSVGNTGTLAATDLGTSL